MATCSSVPAWGVPWTEELPSLSSHTPFGLRNTCSHNSIADLILALDGVPPSRYASVHLFTY